MSPFPREYRGGRVDAEEDVWRERRRLRDRGFFLEWRWRENETVDLEGSVGEDGRYDGEEMPETVGGGKRIWRGGSEGVTVEAEIVEKMGICAVEEGTKLLGANVVERVGGEWEGGENGRNLGERGGR